MTYPDDLRYMKWFDNAGSLICGSLVVIAILIYGLFHFVALSVDYAIYCAIRRVRRRVSMWRSEW